MMKYDLRQDERREGLDQFIEWLQSETMSSLAGSVGNDDAIRAAVFLFMNRALEAHLPERTVGEVLGISAVRAGLSEAEEEVAFDEADFLAGTLGEMYEVYPKTAADG
jgi:hypothetical protein